MRQPYVRPARWGRAATAGAPPAGLRRRPEHHRLARGTAGAPPAGLRRRPEHHRLARGTAGAPPAGLR
ncbi:hypothetical protein ABT116_46070 [Streptomyces sp. NPDC002130]|uniref:hypothetical protein n=1 Tax=Streptomyces sp. NPDC002130 TaxID=3155568 RepID=UPI0033324CDA